MYTKLRKRHQQVSKAARADRHRFRRLSDTSTERVHTEPSQQHAGLTVAWGCFGELVDVLLLRRHDNRCRAAVDEVAADSRYVQQAPNDFGEQRW